MPNKIARADGNVGYRHAHRRLGDVRGACQCGAPAMEWSYIGGDTDELVSEKGRKYSLKPEFYIGMCVACHRRADQEKPSCHRGHDNWYVKPNGRRQCRTCQNIRLQEWRRNKKEMV